MSRKNSAKYKMPVEPVIAANEFQEYVYRSFLMPDNGPAFLETEIKKRVEFLKKKEPHWPSPPSSSKDFPDDRKFDKKRFKKHVIDYATSSLRDYAGPGEKYFENSFLREYMKRKPFLLGPLAQRVAACFLSPKKETNSSSSSESCQEYSERDDNLEFLNMNPLESCGEHSENDDDREFPEVNASGLCGERSENNHNPEFPKMDTLESCKELHENNGNPEFSKLSDSESCGQHSKNSVKPEFLKNDASKSCRVHSENNHHPEFLKMNTSEFCKELHENNGIRKFSKLNASESCGQHSENSDKPEFLKNNSSESCRVHSEKNSMDIPIVNPSGSHEETFDKRGNVKSSKPKFRRLTGMDTCSEELENKLKKNPIIRGVQLGSKIKRCLNKLGIQDDPETEAMGKLFLERRRLMRKLRKQTAKNLNALLNIREKCATFSNNLKLIKKKHQLYEYQAKYFNKKNKKSSSKKRRSVNAKKR